MRLRLVHMLLLAGGILSVPIASQAQIAARVTIAPPPLPLYVQPVCEGDGYIWTPGYWAWDGSYYWVPGTWVLDPEPGFLWTPAYWSWNAGEFIFHEGYWAPTVGFYGGIDYGYGYSGFGYQGGHWEGGHFDYNTALSRVDTSVIHHVYNTKVSDPVSRVSYNGGPGGTTVGPSHDDEAADVTARMKPVDVQAQHQQMARNDPQGRYSANHGTPTVAATAIPVLAVHPRDLPPVVGTAGQLATKQNQDRENLQKKQDKEDQEAKQKGNPAKTGQLEKQHRGQTQEMAQKQARQTEDRERRK